MDSVAQQQLQMLLDLDARHDDLLRRLDELDRRINAVLAEYAPVAAVDEVRQRVDETVKRAA